MTGSLHSIPSADLNFTLFSWEHIADDTVHDLDYYTELLAVGCEV